jgi:hypothetical protein
MSTNIRVNVGNPQRLIDLNRRQQKANREAFVIRDEARRASDKAFDQLERERKAAGLDLATGRPITSAQAASGFPRIDQEPAAFRTGAETLGFNWFIVSNNDTDFNLVNPIADGFDRRSNSPTVQGTNAGRGIYVSSTDGTFWLSQADIPELAAPSGFDPGSTTTYVSGETYRFDYPFQRCVYDVFPVGKGNYVLTFRFQNAYAKGIWIFSSTGFPPVYDFTPSGNVTSGIIEVYKSYLVSKSTVKEIDTPSDVKSYFDAYFPGIVPISITLRRYATPTDAPYTFIQEATTEPKYSGFAESYGSMQSYFQVQNSYLNLAEWKTGWYQDAMPVPSTGGIRRDLLGSPSIYARANNLDAGWLSGFSTFDPPGEPQNNFATMRDWVNASYTQSQSAKKSKTVAYYLPDWNPLFDSPMTTPIPIYSTIENPTNQAWNTPLEPRVDPSLPNNFWSSYKTLSFDDAALPMPSVSNVSSDFRVFCLVTDWGNPAYCYSQALALVFSPADINP